VKMFGDLNPVIALVLLDMTPPGNGEYSSDKARARWNHPRTMIKGILGHLSVWSRIKTKPWP
jgi:hypothetical protein